MWPYRAQGASMQSVTIDGDQVRVTYALGEPGATVTVAWPLAQLSTELKYWIACMFQLVGQECPPGATMTIGDMP